MKGYNFIINIITYWCFRSNVTRIVERQKSKEFPTSPIFLPSKWHIFQLTEQQNVARSKKNTDLNKVDKLKENKENTSSNLCDYFISRNQYLFEDAIKRVEKGINKSFRQIQSILFLPFLVEILLPWFTIQPSYISANISIDPETTFNVRLNDPSAISFYLSDQYLAKSIPQSLLRSSM